jgi:hypothetical protein
LWITVRSGPTIVDAVRVQMFDAAFATELIDFFAPVSYLYQASTPTQTTRWGQLKHKGWSDKP